MTVADYAVILIAALVGSGSPGPSNFAIMATSMGQGRGQGLSIAAGILTGSLMWSSAAALGLASVMAAHAGLVELLRYAAALYLLYLAYKTARSALRRKAVEMPKTHGSYWRNYMRGLGLHLTNPKAIFFFGALYTVGVPAGATAVDIAFVVALVGVQSAFIFLGYAVLFSSETAQRVYLKARRWIDGTVAALFTLAALRILWGRPV